MCTYVCAHHLVNYPSKIGKPNSRVKLEKFAATSQVVPVVTWPSYFGVLL